MKQCQIVLCCQFTPRHFHKWHHTADLAEALLQIFSTSGGQYDAVYWSYLIFNFLSALQPSSLSLLRFWVVIPSDALGRYQCSIQLLSSVWRWPEN